MKALAAGVVPVEYAVAVDRYLSEAELGAANCRRPGPAGAGQRRRSCRSPRLTTRMPGAGSLTLSPTGSCRRRSGP